MKIKYNELSRIIQQEVNEARISDAYMGGRGEHRKDYLMADLNKVKDVVIYSKDLRPSEYKIIDDMEVEIVGKLKEAVESFKIKEFKNTLK